MKQTITLFTIFILIFILSNCSKDKASKIIVTNQDCDSIPKQFNADVLPILTTHCVGCHGSVSPSANISLVTHSDVVSQLSLFINVINHNPGPVPMPYQLPKLSDSLINIIKCWEADGAQNN
jgi:hypothetical protein